MSIDVNLAVSEKLRISVTLLPFESVLIYCVQHTYTGCGQDVRWVAAMKKYGWTKYLKRSAPELPYDSPIYLGSWSNGEFFHEQTAHERKLHRAILEAGDARARKLGMDRREFMASAMGFVTALSV